MAGTTVSYNGVTIKDCQTLRFDQSVEYDESNTDQLFSKFRIRVSGMVHKDQTHFLATEALQGSGSSVNVMIAVQKRLMHPRGSFAYMLEGEVLLAADANPQGGFLDVNSGPKPMDCDITHVAGNQIFRIEFEIEVARVLCVGGQAPANSQGAASNAAILNNRWSVEETKDSDFYTTRTIRGILRVSHIAAWPHIFRYLCVPPLQYGFQRKSLGFADSADGLTLRYEITDQQRYASPPAPATDWDARCTSQQGEVGTAGTYEIYVMLKGGPHALKKDLLAAAATVAIERISGLQRPADNAPNQSTNHIRPLGGSIVEHLSRNVVELRIRVQLISADNVFNMSIQDLDRPLQIPNYDPKKWAVPDLYASNSPRALFFKYLQSPCVDVHGIPSVAAITAENRRPQTHDPTPPEDPDIAELPQQVPSDDQSAKSENQKGDFPYSFVRLDTEYQTDEGIAHLPIARWSSLPGSSPTTVAIPLHNPITQRTLTMHAERVGEWPEVPAPQRTFMDAAGIKNTLLKKKMIPGTPVLLPDGKQYLYSVQVKYIYGMERSPTDTEVLHVPSDPRDSTSLPNNIFDQGRHLTIGNIV